MSRATRIRVFIVSGFSPLTSRAQASDTLSKAPAGVIAIAAAKPAADLCRNPRRENLPSAAALWLAVMIASSSDCRIRRSPTLAEAADVLLQHLDLVAVRILDEEKASDVLSVAVELDDLARVEALSLEAAMLGVQIVDDEGDMAVAVAERVGLRAALVDRQLHLEGRLAVGHV